MKKPILSMVLGMMALAASAQTLDECQQAAAANYPLIKRNGLIQQTADATIANINKGWLPQVQAYAQATTQSKVLALPDALTQTMTAQGVEIKGLAKEQYKIGVDVNQNIYDGGRMKSNKAVARQQAEVDMAQTDVTLYAVRQRVNELYFGLLLVADRLQLNSDLQELLLANEKQIASMVKSGTAADADLYSVRAELMNVKQAAVELQSQQEALRRMLALLTGLTINEPQRPADAYSNSLAEANNRPEIRLIDTQLKLANMQEQALDAALRPTLSAFAQGFYGYPGYDMYKDMMGRTPTLNGMVGVRVAWNIGALYTRKGDKQRLRLQREMAENQRETFLFNNRMETTQQQANIDKYAKLKQQDEEIIDLRSKVRKAAESKLAHGIIDVNDLIKEINSENSAKLQLSIHDIERLREIYNLKYTVNN